MKYTYFDIFIIHSLIDTSTAQESECGGDAPSRFTFSSLIFAEMRWKRSESIVCEMTMMMMKMRKRMIIREVKIHKLRVWEN